MKSANAPTFWQNARGELIRRLGLLVAAFSGGSAASGSKSGIRAQEGPASLPDVVQFLNQAGRAAGLHVWDWDIVNNRLEFDRATPQNVGGDPELASANPQLIVDHGIHPDDRARYKDEFVSALKGMTPLAIDYRILYQDGSAHPTQLRGEIYRDATGRAIRVLGFTIDMSAQQNAAERIAAHSEEHRKAQSKIEQQAAELKQWLEKVQLATETAGVGMWDWDLATGKLSSDTNMAKIFPDIDLSGVTRAEDFIRHILHPDDRETFSSTMKTAIAREGGELVKTHFRYVNRARRTQHVELHGRVLRNKEGRAERFVGVSWNTTSEVEARAEIEQQAEAQRALLERLNLATEVAAIDIWDWDLVTDRITADAYMTDAYGGTHFEHENGRQQILNYAHPEDVAGYYEALDRALASGQTFFHRFRMLLKDGTQRHVQVHARIFRNADGKAVRLLGVTRDFTEEMRHLDELRRQADEERALRDRLNLATRTAGISIWDKDLVRGDFVCDEQFWTIFGLQRDPHFKVHMGIHPDERERALTPLNEAFADPGRDEILAVRHRTSNPRPDPQFVQTHMRVFRNAAGKAVRLLGVTWDVTNEELHANQLQKQADRERAMVERFNAVTKSGGISLWEFDLKTNALSWLGVRQEVYGLDHVPMHDYFGELLKIVVEEDRHKLSSVGRHAFENNIDAYDYEFRVQGVDGKIHRMRNICRLTRNFRGNYRYIMGVTINITKEFEATERLKQRDHENRQLIERLSVATQAAGITPWEFDLKQRRFTWMGERIGIFGLQDVPAEQYLEAHAERVLPEDRHILKDAPTDALAKGLDNFDYQYRATGIDGEVHRMQSHARVMRSEHGRPYRLVGVTWDVTKEVQHAEELRQKAERERALNERLNVATHAAGISLWEYDLKQRRHIWHGRRIAAWGLDDVSIDNFLEELTKITLPQDRHLMESEPRRAIEAGMDSYSYRYRVTGIDGGLHHMQNYVRIQKDPDGSAGRLVGVTWDVTEQVTAAEQLQRRSETERQLIERLNVATQAAGITPWEFDLKHNTFSWVGERMVALGLQHVPPEQYLDAVAAIVLPEDRPVLSEAPREALAKGADMFGYGYRAKGVDGNIRHLQSFAKVIRSTHGRAYRLVGVTWDVTDEVQAAALLQQQSEHERALNERLSMITKAARISPWEFDLKTNKFTWQGVRQEFYGLDDVSLDDYTLALRNIVFEEDRWTLTEPARKAFESNIEDFSYTFRVRGIDGKTHYMKNICRLMRNKRGKFRYLMGVTMEVTKEVEANAQLEQQAQKERALTERLSVATQSAGISSWEIDVKTGKILWTENSLRSADGGNDESGEIRNYSKRMHPDDHYAFRDAMRKAVNEGQDVISYRYRYFRRDGSTAHIQSHAKLYLDDASRVTRALGVSWDITKEVFAAEELQERALQERKLIERLNIATSAANIASWEIDLIASRFLWIENPIKNVTRGDDDKISLEEFSKFVVPEDRQIMPNAIRDALAKKSDRMGFRYRSYGNDDRIAYLQSFARLMVNEEGRPIRLLGVTWDVTREVEAEAQLRSQAERLSNAERRLERASLSSSEGHWEANLATGQLWYSSSFHALLGYREGELEAHINTFDHLIHADDVKKYQNALRAHLMENTPYEVEVQMRTASDDYRWFHMRGMAERQDGVPTLMAGSIHDIHQQKLVEDALDLAQRRFERAINGTQDGLWELDVAGGDSWCSPRLAVLLGYPAAQLATDNFLRSLIHPDDEKKLNDVTIAHYRDNTPFDLEVRLRNRNGDYRWYLARASAERNSAGRALRLSGSLQDVTEARAAREELLRATEAAEAANRAKSAFLANVSHEIRTPMNGIVGMTGLLLDTRLDHTQRDYADTIRSSADSLLSIINDILDFSKIEAGKLDLESIAIDLREIVEDVAAMMAYQATNKGLELIVNVHPEVPALVKGDPQRLRQCMVNLVGNAIKFTKSGEVAIDVCAVGRHEGRVLTHFEIRDTGMGIPKPTLDTLFQPFVQADSSTTRHYGGTGLGLSIVRRLVEMMGGQVGVVSEVGQGSNFFFTLSLETVEEAAATPVQTGDHGGPILIVDDNATNRRVLKLQLSHAGYAVSAVTSGADALTELQDAASHNKPFAMVITDFQMPDMDGAMLAARIAQVPALANTRLVMLTSIDKPGDTQRLAALGFAAYLTKPIRRDELLNCVTRAFAGEARQWQMEIRPMITRSTLTQLETQTRFSGRVLLVEDNIVNQKVATRFLERMGCSVRVADNGAEGFAAFQEERFEVIFMDLQMPVMDGLAATAKIRELEAREPARKRTPIVALTANAMRGDQERCEAAGMDGYLTKPLEIERLRSHLAKFGLATASSAETTASLGNARHTDAIAAGYSPPINLAQLNSMVSDDTDFMRELLIAFLSSGMQQISDIDTAIAAQDRPAIARIAHKLKGGCGNIHAQPLYALVQELEALSSSGSPEQLREQGNRLNREFERVREFLSDPSVMPMPIKVAS